jgi:hypothetical protein
MLRVCCAGFFDPARTLRGPGTNGQKPAQPIQCEHGWPNFDNKVFFTTKYEMHRKIKILNPLGTFSKKNRERPGSKMETRRRPSAQRPGTPAHLSINVDDLISFYPYFKKYFFLCHYEHLNFDKFFVCHVFFEFFTFTHAPMRLGLAMPRVYAA